MNTNGINAQISPKEIKCSKKQAAVSRMQQEFLSQISEGKEAKEAFYNSIKSVSTKYNPQDDEFKTDVSLEQTEGTGCCKASLPKIKITPQEAKQWLEVIAMIGPMIAEFINYVDSLLPKKADHNDKTGQQQGPVCYSTTA